MNDLCNDLSCIICVCYDLLEYLSFIEMNLYILALCTCLAFLVMEERDISYNVMLLISD